MDTKKKIPGVSTTPKPAATATGIVRPMMVKASYGGAHGDVLSASCLKSLCGQLSEGYVSNAHAHAHAFASSTSALDIDIENFSISTMPDPEPAPALTDCLYDDDDDDTLNNFGYYMKYNRLRRSVR